MANATLKTREATVTLELSELEAAVVLGLVGTAYVQPTDALVGNAASRVRQALVHSGLEKRMTDYGWHVGRSALVKEYNGNQGFARARALVRERMLG